MQSFSKLTSAYWTTAVIFVASLSFYLDNFDMLVNTTGAPCNRTERRTTNSYECFRVNFYVKRVKPREPV